MRYHATLGCWGLWVRLAPDRLWNFFKWWVLKSKIFGQKSTYLLKEHHCIFRIVHMHFYSNKKKYNYAKILPIMHYAVKIYSRNHATGKLGVKWMTVCQEKFLNRTYPLLISTDFLKYPFWHLFSVQDLELRKNFTEHWKKISVSL